MNLAQQIHDQVIAALAAPTGFKAEEITADMRLVNDLYMDSLDILETVMAVEESCHVALMDDDINQLKTVGDLIGLVQRMRGAEWVEG